MSDQNPSKHAGETNWLRLVQQLRREAELCGGFGEVTVRIVFRDSYPQTADVIQRSPRYRLDRGTTETEN